MKNKPDSVPEPTEDSAEVRSLFVRKRNALTVRAHFEPLYVDFYLHLMQHSITLQPQHDQMLKDALAAMTLHLASRPWNEVSAWTIHFDNPLLNIFVSGDSNTAGVTGRVFTEDVRNTGQNLFVAQTSVYPEPPRKSIVEFQPSDDIFNIVEQFYAQSEQRPAKIFRYAEEDIVLVSAQPHCDMEWFDSLTEDKIRTLDQDEELSLLETRYYKYDCGCTLERVLPALSPFGQKDIDEIFSERSQLKVTCPRCAAIFMVTRKDIEDFRAKR